MKKKKTGVLIPAVILLALLSVALYAVASADGGTRDDPLVTLGYVNEVLKPQMQSELSASFEKQKTEISAELEAKINAADDKINAYIAEIGKKGTESEAIINAAAEEAASKLAQKGIGAPTAPSAPTWSVVKLSAGQTVTCSIGCEIVLRLGTATCVSSGSTGPIDLTSASVLAPDKGYAVNHLYLVTIENRGIKAGSNGCTVLIKGDYK